MRMSVTKVSRVKAIQPLLQAGPVFVPALPPVLSQPAVLNPDELHLLIARRAYDLHAERGYRQGFAVEDWLEAEREILSGNRRAAQLDTV